jgi:hypothetical protein
VVVELAPVEKYDVDSSMPVFVKGFIAKIMPENADLQLMRGKIMLLELLKILLENVGAVET